MPSFSAAITAIAVLRPWPISTELVRTFKLASSLSLTMAVDVEGVTVLLMMQLRPLARTLLPTRSGGSSDFQSMPRAAPARRRRQQLAERAVFHDFTGRKTIAVAQQVLHPQFERV